MHDMNCEMCGKKFSARNNNAKYCSKECRIKSMRNEEREKRRTEKEKLKNEKKAKTAPKISWEKMAELMREYNLSYGKVEDAIRCGRIKVEEC